MTKTSTRFLRATSSLVLLAALAGAACTGFIGDGDEGKGSNNSPSGGSGTQDVPPDALLASITGLRRLTIDEYDNTLRDLLGDDTRPASLLLPYDPRSPFDNDYTQQVASQALIEGAEKLAGEAAGRLLLDPARRDDVVGCTPSGPDDQDCLRDFVERFGRRALRRSLTQDEITAYMGAGALAVEANDFYAGIDVAIRAFLQEPYFLYRVEIGTPEGEGLHRLGGTEIASRLSYFLWGSLPDDALLDLAETGELDTPEGVRAAASTMLKDPRARTRVARFHSLWLGYETLPYDPALVASMMTETSALLDRVIFDEQTAWHDIFRSAETYVDDALADHYGIEPPGSDIPVWTPYGASGRQGLLSHGSFLSIGAKFDDTSPTLRGLAIRTRLFCQDIPPPPPEVNTDDPVPTTEDAVCKVDRYAVHAQDGCAGCHVLMDPVGFGLENYDQQGRYRTVEAEHPECVIEGKGMLAGVGEFHGPAELADLMLEEGVLNGCVATQLYRFAVGRYELDANDRDFIERLGDQMGTGDFRFDELLLEYVGNPAFGFRREEE